MLWLHTRFITSIVIYILSEIPFPNSKEKAGRFVGIAENVGYAMTFWVWTEDTEQLIARSVIRSAEDPNSANKRVEFNDAEPKSDQVPQVVGMRDLIPEGSLPIIDPDQLVGYKKPVMRRAEKPTPGWELSVKASKIS